jgi:hypothetical protein
MTMNNSTTMNSKRVPMPITLTDDGYGNEVRLVSTVFLRDMAELTHGKPDAHRTEVLNADITNSMRLLARYGRIRGASPLNVFMDALASTRRQSRALMKAHGDPLENPAPFAQVFADNVLKQVETVQMRLAGVDQTAAA